MLHYPNFVRTLNESWFDQQIISSVSQLRAMKQKILRNCLFIKKNVHTARPTQAKKAWFEHLLSLCKMGIQKTQSYSLYQQWSLKWGVSIPRGSFWFSTYVVKHPKVVFLYCNLFCKISLGGVLTKKFKDHCITLLQAYIIEGEVEYVFYPPSFVRPNL